MKTIINIIASAGLVIAPFSAMASAGWAFDNSNVSEVRQGAGYAKNSHDKQKGGSGAGWAFNNPNVPQMRKGAGSGEVHYDRHNDSHGAGWAFDQPHEPMGYEHSSS